MPDAISEAEARHVEKRRRIAEQAWDEGYVFACVTGSPDPVNPYREPSAIPPPTGVATLSFKDRALIAEVVREVIDEMTREKNRRAFEEFGSIPLREDS